MSKPISTVLIVEDEPLICLMLCDMLEACGVQLCHQAHTLREARHYLDTVQLDAVLLDINLAGISSLPFAGELARRQIPFAFTTGYGQTSNEPFPTAPALRKPFMQDQVKMVLDQLANAGPGKAN